MNENILAIQRPQSAQVRALLSICGRSQSASVYKHRDSADSSFMFGSQKTLPRAQSARTVKYSVRSLQPKTPEIRRLERLKESA